MNYARVKSLFSWVKKACKENIGKWGGIGFVDSLRWSKRKGGLAFLLYIYNLFLLGILTNDEEHGFNFTFKSICSLSLILVSYFKFLLQILICWISFEIYAVLHMNIMMREVNIKRYQLRYKIFGFRSWFYREKLARIFSFLNAKTQQVWTRNRSKIAEKETGDIENDLVQNRTKVFS